MITPGQQSLTNHCERHGHKGQVRDQGGGSVDLRGSLKAAVHWGVLGMRSMGSEGEQAGPSRQKGKQAKEWRQEPSTEAPDPSAAEWYWGVKAENAGSRYQPVG